VQRSSINLPGGSIRAEDGDILLRSDGQAYTGEEFERIVLRSQADGSRLYLSDVATVIDGFEERLGYARFDGKRSVGVEVNSVDNQNALAIAETVKAYIERKQEELPDTVTVEYWGELTQFLSDRLNLMLTNMVQGAILVFLVLALFLQLKVAFWVMLGLPICFLAALMVMPMAPVGLSINMITLFGFILVLGIVVDDAIVIGEASYAQTEKDGHSTDAVIKGARRVAMPATFGVLTTVAAFIPMLMVTGFMGAITASIAGVVILCLLFSLVESKLILPAHLAHMTPPKPGQGWGPWLRLKERFHNGVQWLIHAKYKPAVTRLMEMRYSVLAFFIGMMILCGGLIQSGLVRTVSFPDIPSDFINVQLEMENGVSERQTLRAVQQMEEALFTMNDEIAEEIGLHGDAHLAAAGVHVDGVVVVDAEDGAVARRRLGELVDLVAQRRDVLARLAQRVGELLVLRDGLGELALGLEQTLFERAHPLG